MPETLPFDHCNALMIRQRKELAEIVLSFETRNKYEVLTEDGRPVAFAAEQGKGFAGMLFRQMLGHWRTFDIHVFNPLRDLVMIAHHPFRFLFQRLEVRDAAGAPIGAIQQRFGILYKKFDIEDANGRLLMTMQSPLWRIWTFPLMKVGRQVSVIKKQWSGLLKEAFTDADNFRIGFDSPDLSSTERALIVAAALFVDLIYFERKSND
jgi:uncharacterized protein YxjI